MTTMTEAEPEAAQLTADVVVFGERDGETHVLLIRRGWAPFVGCWALPGGYVDHGEKTEDAARRELREETGLSVGALIASGVYSEPGRDPRGRFVSFAYTARVPGLPQPVTSDDPENDTTGAQWTSVADVLTGTAPLAFDHARIVHDALRVAGV